MLPWTGSPYLSKPVRHLRGERAGRVMHTERVLTNNPLHARVVPQSSPVVLFLEHDDLRDGGTLGLGGLEGGGSGQATRAGADDGHSLRGCWGTKRHNRTRPSETAHITCFCDDTSLQTSLQGCVVHCTAVQAVQGRGQGRNGRKGREGKENRGTACRLSLPSTSHSAAPTQRRNSSHRGKGASADTVDTQQ